jgi:drug/metabolite transporter (DMT)-like permease
VLLYAGARADPYRARNRRQHGHRGQSLGLPGGATNSDGIMLTPRPARTIVSNVVLRRRAKELLLVGALLGAIPFTLIALAELQVDASLAAVINATLSRRSSGGQRT